MEFKKTHTGKTTTAYIEVYTERYEMASLF